MARVRTRIRRTERGALSPAVAFAVLVITLAAILAAFGIFDRRGSDREPTPAPAPTASLTEEGLSLTDSEALARFEELDALRIQAYEEGNAGLLRQVFSPSGPTYEIVKGEIELLRSESVRSRTSFRTRQLKVVENSSAQIRIRQRVVVRPRFVDAAGRDVTGRATDELQTIDWTLVPAGSGWLIEDSIVVTSRPV